MTRASSIPPKSGVASSPARKLVQEEAAIFETFVVPRYLSFFGERLLEMIVPGSDARVCHLGCRTGYPDRALLERLPGAHVHGVDASEHAIELARAKALALKPEATKGSANEGVVFDYRVAEGLPTSFPPGAFSHAFTLHPLATPAERRLIFEELARIVAPRGQALVAMPMRGSFVEIADLLRECALKYELSDLMNAVEAAALLRPTDDMLKRDFEVVGFEYVEVDVWMRTLKYAGGRSFFEDPVTRLLLMPEFRVSLPLDESGNATIPISNAGGTTPGLSVTSMDPFAYVREAIDKYWSDGTFEMTVNVGVVSGRRRI